jgi:hypothetical protein
MTIIQLNPKGYEMGGSYRIGTAFGTRHDLARVLGPPHGSGEGLQVSTEWFLETGQGRVCIRDYHLNAPDQWTIAGSEVEPVRLVVEWLSLNHIQARMDRDGEWNPENG